MPDFLRFEKNEQTKRVELRNADGSAFQYELSLAMKGAVNAAIAASRPLLVQGPPGVGKTQLAEAAAKGLERAFLPFVVDSKTDHRELLWRFDAVKRLAVAQTAPHRFRNRPESEIDAALDDALADARFVEPGPLWWALHWRSAWKQATGTSAESLDKSDAKSLGAVPLARGDNFLHKDNGWVLLIDEIDKAESDVPNGLLEALGSQRFTPPGVANPVEVSGTPPLVVLTTNEERSLPAAFLRRCLALHLRFPTDENEGIALLLRRGQSHFPNALSDEVMTEAATMLWEQRKAAIRNQEKPHPGTAEYVDLLRAVIRQRPKNLREQRALLKEAATYVLRKHPDS